MAWRIDEAVIRGEIDNQIRGKVTGRIWFKGLEQPVLLDLSGNCRRDLAGCRLSFVNPSPRRDPCLEDFNLLQDGTVGDMTAARKIKVPTVSSEELQRLFQARLPIPCQLGNAVYLEWFSRTNGRVVIESAAFRCSISERHWNLSDEEDRRQSFDQEEAMLDFLNQIAGPEDAQDHVLPADDSQSLFAGEVDFEDPDAAPAAWEAEPAEKPMDEFEAERFLQECDRRTDRYMQLLDQYEDHPEQERLIAEAMGWDRSPEVADATPASENAELAPPSEASGDLWEEETSLTEHPLCHRVHALCVRLHRESKPPRRSDSGSNDPVEKLHRAIIYASGKLAGALNGGDDHLCLEPGITVAWLKRALSFLHEAIDGAVAARERKSVPEDWIRGIHAELFDIRTEILRLMETYRRMID